MGKGKKNKKKSFYKKSIAPLLGGDNKIWVAALGGVAAGITLAGIFGSEKANQIISKVSDAIRDVTEKVKDGFDSDSGSGPYKANHKRQLADKQPA